MLLVKDEPTFLAFNVNGDKKITEENLKELTDQGYKVTFKTTKEVLGEDTTKGTTDEKGMAKAQDGFEYQVVVEKGEEKFETEWTAVKVADKTTVTKVNKVELVEKVEEGNGEKWEQAVLDGKVTFKVTEWENAFGDKNTDEGLSLEIPTIASAKSSNTAIAAYANGVIKVFKDGKVDFTISFGENSKIEDYVLKDVEVKTEQKIGSAKAEDLTVKTPVDLQDENRIQMDFEILDQDGEPFLEKDKEVYVDVLGEDGKVIGTGGEETVADGKITAKIALTEEGTYTVVVKDKQGGKELGRAALTLIGIEDEKVDHFKITLSEESKNTKLDVKENGTQELVYNVEAFIKGAKVDMPGAEELEIVVEDEKIIEANFNDNDKSTIIVTKATDLKEAGKTSFQINLKEGAKLTPIKDSVEVEVINTNVQIENLELKDDKKPVQAIKGDEDKIIITAGNIAAAVKLPEGVESAEELEGMIDSQKIVILENDNIVKVTMNEANGGKTFDLAFEIATEDAE